MELELLEKITGNGLFSEVDGGEPYFAWQGCDYCNARTGKRLGAKVYDCTGFASLEEAKTSSENYYEFRLCGGCLCAIANGDLWPEDWND